MKLINTLGLLALVSFTSAHADEVSKKVCESFLPAFSDSNIDLINNGFKKEFQGNEKGAKLFNSYMKNVEDSVSKVAQERCDKGIFPAMDLNGCYDKCKGEVAKAIPGTFAWNYQDRVAGTNKCYQACTGAYVAQNAITKTIRKEMSNAVTCSSTAVFDSSKAKNIEKALERTPSTEESSAIAK